MLRWHSAQSTDEAQGGEARTEQFELLKDFILEEYYRPEEIEGWKLSEMERPGRETVLRLIRFFSDK